MNDATEVTPTTAPDYMPIPKAKYAPKPEKQPKHLRESPNHADKEETVEKVKTWCKAYLDKFKTQTQRTQAETEMAIADELHRAASSRTSLNTDQSSNREATQSKIQSATFYSDHRAFTANEKAVLLGNTESLPVKYEPIPGSTDYSEDEGERLANYQNALLTYTWQVSQVDNVVAKELWVLNKYGNSVIEAIWDKRVEKRWVKRPKFKKVYPNKMAEMLKVGGKEDTTEVETYGWEQTDVTLADWPKFLIYDMKDVWFDCMIDDMQLQSCVAIRFQKQLADVWNLQKTSEFMNVGKIKQQHFYKGESGYNTVKNDRQTAAGEGGDAESPTTLLDIWKFWIRIPVNDETGAWEPDKELCHWYKVHFAGDINGDCVCLELRPNPHSCGLIPVNLAHAIEDDKGAFHVGMATLGKSYYAEEMTLIDMANDNVRNRNRVPLLVEKGSINIRDYTFSAGGNRIWQYKAGTTQPKELKIEDTTSITIPLLNTMAEMRKNILGTNKAFMGEPIGGRQSASGYLGTLDQALKPAMEDAKYKADQILPFIAFWNKEMWYDFGDPEVSLMVTYEGEQLEVKPKNLYGDFRIRVTSIKNFQDSALKRKEQNELIAQVLPVMISTGALDQQGAKILSKQILADRHITQLDEIFRTGADFDARHVARSENMAIIWQGIIDMPKPEENHAVHLREHESYLGTVVLLPEASLPPKDNIDRMKQHIQMHKNFAANPAGMQGAPQQQGIGANPNAPTPGEVTGDMISGNMGTMANQPAEPTGRPPEYSGQEAGAIV